MSIVSGVTLICSCLEEDDINGSTVPNVMSINDWLHTQGFGNLLQCEQHGGTKHPQCLVFLAGYNYFSRLHSEFAEYVMSLPWQCPENVVLVIQPEEGETLVVRPGPLKRW